MQNRKFPVIDAVATGENIRQLRKAKGMSVRDLQKWFNFDEPRAIYKWQSGKSLPSLDNLYALSAVLETSMDKIIVPVGAQKNNAGLQEISCKPAVSFSDAA